MNCGFKVEYTLKKPNFCPNCGDGIREISDVDQESLAKEEVAPVEESRSWLQGGLEYNIQSQQKSNITFGSLIEEAKHSSAPGSPTERPLPQTSEKDGLRESMDSCLPSRQSEDIGGQENQ